MTRNRSAGTLDIEAVRSLFDHWRQTRQGKARIHDEANGQRQPRWRAAMVSTQQPLPCIWMAGS